MRGIMGKKTLATASCRQAHPRGRVPEASRKVAALAPKLVRLNGADGHDDGQAVPALQSGDWRACTHTVSGRHVLGLLLRVQVQRIAGVD